MWIHAEEILRTAIRGRGYDPDTAPMSDDDINRAIARVQGSCAETQDQLCDAITKEWDKFHRPRSASYWKA